MTVPNDLFASFDNVLLEKNYTIGNELSVYEFMSNWTLQSGYPVLDITKNETSSTFWVTQVMDINLLYSLTNMIIIVKS